MPFTKNYVEFFANHGTLGSKFMLALPSTFLSIIHSRPPFLIHHQCIIPKNCVRIKEKTENTDILHSFLRIRIAKKRKLPCYYLKRVESEGKGPGWRDCGSYEDSVYRRRG